MLDLWPHDIAVSARFVPPVDEIKIDKSFVTHMATDSDDATIVASTIGLGHSLSLSFVAEGVEDARTWQSPAALSCDGVQGYYVSRALPSGRGSPPSQHAWAIRPRSGPP